MRGEQAHFHAAVAKALDLDGKNSHLTFGISIDLIQSLRHKVLTYRVDYAIETPKGNTAHQLSPNAP